MYGKRKDNNSQNWTYKMVKDIIGFYGLVCDEYNKNKDVIGPVTKEFWDDAIGNLNE